MKYSLLCLCCCVAAQDLVPGRLLLRSNHTLDAVAEDSLLKGHGASVEKEIPGVRVKVLKVPEAAREKVMDALQRSGRFEFVEPDYKGKILDFVPNDAMYSSQWALPKISAPQAWGLSQGSTAFPIAVLDSGIDLTHPDLTSKLLPGYNAVTGSTDNHDIGCSSGHGTAVSGTAAAIGNNGIGVAGVAWMNPIIPVMISKFSATVPGECEFFYSDLSAGVTWAADHGAKVINISGAGVNASSTVQSAVNYAWSKNVIVVASAGNNGTSTPMYPGACNHVVAVGATLSNDALASWSQFGSWIAVVAPGYNIYTTMLGGKYGAWWGTSFSSPIVAGLLALAWGTAPSLTPAQLITAMEQNTDDLGPAGFDDHYGWGRVNAYKFLYSLVPVVPVVCNASVDGAVAVCKASMK